MYALFVALLQVEAIAVDAAPAPSLELAEPSVASSGPVDREAPEPEALVGSAGEQVPQLPLIPTVTEDPTGSAAGAPAGQLHPALEAIRRPADEPAATRDFAEFVDRRLLVLELDPQGLSVRQRERVVRITEDEFAEIFQLVPEAQALAVKAQKAFRVGAALQTVGAATNLGGATLLLVGTLMLSPMSLAIAVIGGGGAMLVGCVAMALAQPFLQEAAKTFSSAIAAYNRGLLDLRPAGTAPALLTP